MTTFFKSPLPGQIAALETEVIRLDGAIKTLKAEFELELLKRQQAFDTEIEEMENQLLERIRVAEKTARGNSLKSADATEPSQLSEGYVTWSQRKARRIIKTGSPDFAEKTLKRSQRGQSASMPSAGQIQPSS